MTVFLIVAVCFALLCLFAMAGSLGGIASQLEVHNRREDERDARFQAAVGEVLDADS